MATNFCGHRQPESHSGGMTCDKALGIRVFLRLKLSRKQWVMMAVLASFLSSVALVSAQSYKNIAYPGAIQTHAYGINAFGQIVGDWQDSNGVYHAFLYSSGNYTAFDYPGATSTTAYSINNSGDIVGSYSGSNGGGPFLYKDGVFTTLTASYGAVTDVTNRPDFMVVNEGYVNDSGVFTKLNDPNAVANDTIPWGMNDLVQVVGFYEDPSFFSHGFLYSAGSYTTIDLPGQDVTFPHGINNHGTIVGEYDDAVSVAHGFILNPTTGTYTRLDYPGVFNDTNAYHINDFGQVVGTYPYNSSFDTNGFLYLPAARNPVPLINEALVPETVVPGSGGFTLTINGTGFLQGALVYWNGAPQQTSFVSGKQVTASIPSSLVTAAGTASVVVTNPGPGGGSSNVQFFQVAEPIPAISVSQTTLIAGSSPQRNVAADFNHDGIMDLAAVDGTNNQVLVMLGNGNGTFRSPVTFPTGTNPSNLIAADFNGDGNIDLAVSNYNGNSVSVLLGNGDGTFRTQSGFATGAGPWSLAAGDFNGDGRLDLAVVNQTGNSVSILLGNGDGTFQFHGDIPADTDPRSIAIGDFNGDGHLDLAVTNFGNFSGNTVSVFLGNGDGTFQSKVDYTVSGAPLSVVAADLNGDGKLDLAVDNSCGSSSTCGRPGSVSVLLGKGDGTFQPHVDYAAGEFPYTIIAGDFNGDGKIDLAVADLDSSAVTVLTGAGDGTFPNSTALAANAQPVGLLAADFNGDGMLDFAAGSGSGILVMLQNGVPLPTVASVSLSPSTVFGGGNSTGTVTLSGPAPANGAIVTLSSSNTAAATIPSPGTVTVADGSNSATFTVNAQNVASNASSSISASYNNSSESATLQVLTTTTSTNLSSSANPAVVGQSITFTATVSGQSGIPSGNVGFFNGATLLTTLPLSNGQAGYTRVFGSAGTRSITAVYSGDSTYQGSTSAALSEVVMASPAPVTMTLSSSAPTVLVGQSVTFTATVSSTAGSIPNGEMVSFKDVTTNVVLGSAPLSGGVASLSTTTLAYGSHTIKAKYPGDPDFLGATASVTQVVQRYSSSTTLTSSVNPAGVGQPITFLAIVSGHSPTGSVTFSQNGTALTTIMLTNGQASYTKSFGSAGTKSITASYSGDSNNKPSTSAALSQVIN